jgi:hypothetical protein
VTFNKTSQNDKRHANRLHKLITTDMIHTIEYYKRIKWATKPKPSVRFPTCGVRIYTWPCAEAHSVANRLNSSCHSSLLPLKPWWTPRIVGRSLADLAVHNPPILKKTHKQSTKICWMFGKCVGISWININSTRHLPQPYFPCPVHLCYQLYPLSI